MACGCSKNFSKFRTGNVIRPTNKSISGPAPQLRAQSLNTTGLNAERRKTQSIRRDAIRRSLNK